MIDLYPDNFAEFTTETGNIIDSKLILKANINKINNNIKNYKQTDYAKKGEVMEL